MVLIAGLKVKPRLLILYFLIIPHQFRQLDQITMGDNVDKINGFSSLQHALSSAFVLVVNECVL